MGHHRKDVIPAAMIAMGNCCLALSSAIAELTKVGMKEQALELAVQLTRNSTALRIAIRDDQSWQSTETVGYMEAQKWMLEFLNGSPKMAGEVLTQGEKAGLSKSQM